MSCCRPLSTPLLALPRAASSPSHRVLASLDPILRDLTVLFALCVGVVLVFHRLRVPPIVGFLLTGPAIGPNALGLVRHRELVDQLSEIGVVILLFSVGMELPLRQLAALKRTLLLGGGLQMALTVILGTAAALVGGKSLQSGLLLGLLLAMSSTAVAMKLLADRGDIGSPVARISMPILVAQDLAVVPVILLLPLLGGGDASLGALLGKTAMAFFWLAAAMLAAKLLAPRVIELVCRTRSREAFVLTLIVLCLGMAVATGQMGLSLALGAFLAGVVLADSDYHHMAVAEIAPFRDALSSLFFVSIGMLFDPTSLLRYPWTIGFALLAVLVGKTAVVTLVAKLLGKPGWVGLRSGLLIAQVGEFSFVLLQIADQNLLPERWREVFLAVAVLSIAATPVLYALAGRVHRTAVVESPAGGVAEAHAGHGHPARRDHAIVVGFGPTGQAVGRALRGLRIPYVVVEMNADTVKAQRENGIDIFVGDSTRSQVLYAAGVTHARVLVLAINDPQATRNTAALARQLVPNLPILARANYLGEIDALHRAGVSEVVPQELETATEMMARTLRFFLVPDDEIGRRVRLVRDAVPGGRRAAPDQQLDPVEVGRFIPGVQVCVSTVEAGSPADGKSLAQLQMRKRTGVNVIAAKRGAEVLTNIEPDRILAAADILVLLGPGDRMGDAGDLLRAP